jgi:hypothetical protein
MVDYSPTTTDLVSAAEEADKTFEANSFCPSNVSFSVECLPARYESPSSPTALDDDGNADSRARVRERPNIEQFNRSGYGPPEI